MSQILPSYNSLESFGQLALNVATVILILHLADLNYFSGLATSGESERLYSSIVLTTSLKAYRRRICHFRCLRRGYRASGTRRDSDYMSWIGWSHCEMVMMVSRSAIQYRDSPLIHPALHPTSPESYVLFYSFYPLNPLLAVMFIQNKYIETRHYQRGS
ncbi:hypothetical protein BDP27DRAFT_313450 [Rhodocollybia butyracea]|uniref:Uncharacterized protein n=1 Tax=Rhodocollybia butyracea TaxID=206335 RepID=A0A9P5PGT0_9AGAR|nr:hypothetical protein BDP27DRAFT_313450 [Rhodocollybia butyracea]